MQRVMILGLAVVGTVLSALHALFSVAGLQFGWWSAPAFVPVGVWLLVSAAMRRAVRPMELDGLRWRQRLAGAAVLAFLFWLCWPLWSGPAAGAWRAAHGGFSGVAHGGPRYPLHAVLVASPLALHAVLVASPLALGLVAFLLLACGMVLAPVVRERDRRRPGPPAGPEPLQAPLTSQRPRHPRWP